jgi:ABC-type multidrug transport system fused ATPase/permease subunit
VLINGRPSNPGTIAACGAVVEQDITLFRGSVRENIDLGENISEAALNKALRVLGCIRGSPDESSAVEENGANFSMGQLQALELARALARCPGFMILDEATSSLDGAQSFLSELRSIGCALFVISHEPQIVREAGTILVLDEGRIVARGSFTELSDSCTLFREVAGL